MSQSCFVRKAMESRCECNLHKGRKNFYMFKLYGRNIAIIPNGTRPRDLKTDCEVLFICPLFKSSEILRASSFK